MIRKYYWSNYFTRLVYTCVTLTGGTKKKNSPPPSYTNMYKGTMHVPVEANYKIKYLNVTRYANISVMLLADKVYIITH